MAWFDVFLDVWAPLNFTKRLGGDAGRGDAGTRGRSWVPPADQRRLKAYEVLKSYRKNCARTLHDHSDRDAKELREYGDAALFVRRVKAMVLGDDQTIVVRDADRYRQRLKDTATEEERTANDELKPAFERQEELREWADDENLELAMFEAENDSVELGDGAYLLYWSNGSNRVRVDVYDPGFYFPVLEDNPRQYPRKVHFAWEVAPAVDGEPTRVRRITYELAAIGPQTRVEIDPKADNRPRRVFDFPDDHGPAPLREGDVEREDGRIERRLPYQDADEDPATVTCYLSDATWDLDDATRAGTLDDLLRSDATFGYNEDGELLDRFDLGIDFLPVVHVPNTPAGREHFGQASLADILQVLDDLHGADTDTNSSSALAGNPPIGLSGVKTPTDKVTGEPLPLDNEPGAVWGLGEDGHLETLDTSNQLRALREHTAGLRSLAAQNIQLSDSALGRVKPSEVPSGFAFELGFVPTAGMVRDARLIRKVKYRLFVKFVQRLAIVGGSMKAPVFAADMRFGAYIPTDVDAGIKRIKELHDAGLISTLTALQMLMELGIPIDDVDEEWERIKQEDFDGANALADATGSPELAAERLGVEIPEPPKPEPVPVPVPPGPQPPPGPEPTPPEFRPPVGG